MRAGPEGFDLASGRSTRIALQIVNQASKIGFAVFIYTVQDAWVKRIRKADIEGDAFVQTLITGFDGTIVPESIQPLGPNGEP